MERPSDITIDTAIEQNYDLMVRYCVGRIGNNDAEDIVIEAFFLLGQKWDLFDNHNEKVITAWLYKTLDNKCKEYYRLKKRRSAIIKIEKTIVADDLFYASEEKLVYSSYISEIRKRLTPAERDLFDCIVVDEMSFKSAAEFLKITDVATRVRWLRTKNHINSFINDIFVK